ncbi:Estrogen-related receptor gamma [Lamellibrachia satsuma]|nr:Estrogen-related receptor gamma [Lamellibrachia satsuma]
MMGYEQRENLGIKLERDCSMFSSSCGTIGGLGLSLNGYDDIDSMNLPYRGEDGDLSCGASSPESFDDKPGMDSDGCKSPNRLCLVCGDIASGFHYGVASCEACKAFFKRTVRGNIEYTCPASSNCMITKRRRRACQACRFHKCLRMGMLKEGVRQDRKRGGRSMYLRSPKQLIMPIGVKNTSRDTMQPRIQMTAYLHLNVVPAPTPRGVVDGDNKILAALLSIEPEKVYAMPDASLPDDEYKLTATLSDLADRELVATIGWAKQVPGFLSLSLSDQMVLLQSTWLDIQCFNLVYHSSPYQGILVFADDFKCSEEDAIKMGLPLAYDAASRQLARKLSLLKITKEEYVLMKAILVLNPDMNVENTERVQELQDRIHDALIEYERAHGVAASQRRSGNLLLALPLLMQVKILAKEYWFQVKKSDSVPLHKLLSEMLEYARS